MKRAWRTALLVLLVVPVGLFAWGGYGAWQAWKYRSTAEMTYAQYLQRKPYHGWMRLKNVRIDLRRAAALPDQGGVVHEVLLPVEPVSSAPAEVWPVYVVLATRNPEITFIVDQMAFMEKTKQGPALASYVASHRDSIVRTADLEGLATPDPPASTKIDRKNLRKVAALEEDYVVLVEGAKPNLLMYVGIIVVGALAGLCLYLMHVVPPPFMLARRPTPRQPRPRSSQEGARTEGLDSSSRPPSPRRPEPSRPVDDDEEAVPPASAAEAELMDILRSPAPPRRPRPRSCEDEPPRRPPPDKPKIM